MERVRITKNVAYKKISEKGSLGERGVNTVDDVYDFMTSKA